MVWQNVTMAQHLLISHLQDNVLPIYLCDRPQLCLLVYFIAINVTFIWINLVVYTQYKIKINISKKLHANSVKKLAKILIRKLYDFEFIPKTLNFFAQYKNCSENYYIIVYLKMWQVYISWKMSQFFILKIF